MTSAMKACGPLSFQATMTWKQSTDPDFEAKKNRVLKLHDIAECKAAGGEADPTLVVSVDEFGPLNLVPRLGRHWAPTARSSGKFSG